MQGGANKDSRTRPAPILSSPARRIGDQIGKAVVDLPGFGPDVGIKARRDTGAQLFACQAGYAKTAIVANPLIDMRRGDVPVAVFYAIVFAHEADHAARIAARAVAYSSRRIGGRERTVVV